MPANVSDEDTWALEATGTIDLTDPRLRTAGSDFARGLVDGDLGDTLGASQTLGDYVINDSDLVVQYHKGESGRTGVDVFDGHVLAFGLDGGHSTQESTSQDAWYRPGGGDWTLGACDQ